MAFSFCNRNKGTYDKSNNGVYNYSINDIQTTQGFKKNPLLCPGLTQAFVQNRSFPKELIDVNTQIKGQDSHFQHCFEDNTELQFSSLRPFYGLPKGPPLTVQVNSFGESRCNDLWIGQNASRPIAGIPDTVSCEQRRMKF